MITGVIESKVKYDKPFSEDEFLAAFREWGCNCGPAALAFALGVKPDRVRDSIPGFQQKGYMNPSMMSDALRTIRRQDGPLWQLPAHASRECMYPCWALPVPDGNCTNVVRIQWTGPWTKTGSSPAWAYRYTHYIATWIEKVRAADMSAAALECGANDEYRQMVFDCNGGPRTLWEWAEEVAPVLAAAVPRADGHWYPTHVWRVARPAKT